MARRRRTPARCKDCQQPIRWFKSPYSSKWRTFDPDPVNPRTWSGSAAYPTEGVRAWTLREFTEELMVRREQSRHDASEEAHAFPWYVLHICPTRPTDTPTQGADT